MHFLFYPCSLCLDNKHSFLFLFFCKNLKTYFNLQIFWECQAIIVTQGSQGFYCGCRLLYSIQWLSYRSVTFLWTLFPLTDAELWTLGWRYSLGFGLTCLLDQGHRLACHLFQRHADDNCPTGSQDCPDF